MYRYSNGQISLADFKQPVGMNLKESNRCVTSKRNEKQKASHNLICFLFYF